jgi:hypothetical protein
MIHVMSTSITNTDNPVITFKLTPPIDVFEDEFVEALPERIVKLGLGGNVFRALGYKWIGGNIDQGLMFYQPIDPDRFTLLGSPLYLELMLDPEKKQVLRCRNINPTLKSGESAVTVTTLPLGAFQGT